MTICIDGTLRDFRHPWVMGILNVTPDSFYARSRTLTDDGIVKRVRQMLDEGADCLDIGGYSSRPGCADISADEEYRRLATALEQVRKISEDAIVSVDTFRASIARKCVEEWGVQIINDISGGMMDPDMYETIGDLGVAYVLMHMRGTPRNMTDLTDYTSVMGELISDLAFKLADLRQSGVADVIIDPGFGFAKNTPQNFEILRQLEELRILECPVLVGMSRKSMIWRTLGITPEESLNGTSVLNAFALVNGASILRVHDVRAAKETVRLYEEMIRD